MHFGWLRTGIDFLKKSIAFSKGVLKGIFIRFFTKLCQLLLAAPGLLEKRQKGFINFNKKRKEFIKFCQKAKGGCQILTKKTKKNCQILTKKTKKGCVKFRKKQKIDF